MEQIAFNVDGEYLVESVETLAPEAPQFLHDAWRKAKQDRIREFKEKQNLPYDKKLERQAGIAWEYYKRISEMDMLNAVRIILDPGLVEHTNQPARRHRKKRIAKKWLKRYGRRTIPDTNVYLFDGNVMMHPAIYKKLADAVGEEEATEGLRNLAKAKAAETEAKHEP